MSVRPENPHAGLQERGLAGGIGGSVLGFGAVPIGNLYTPVSEDDA